MGLDEHRSDVAARKRQQRRVEALHMPHLQHKPLTRSTIDKVERFAVSGRHRLLDKAVDAPVERRYRYRCMSGCRCHDIESVDIFQKCIERIERPHPEILGDSIGTLGSAVEDSSQLDIRALLPEARMDHAEMSHPGNSDSQHSIPFSVVYRCYADTEIP